MDKDQIYRSLIVKWQKENKYLVNNNTADHEKIIGASFAGCDDNFNFYFKRTKDNLESIFFEGKGCAISTSSNNIIIENIFKHKINNTKEYLVKVLEFINTGNSTIDLGDYVVFENIHKLQNRIPCASIGPLTILKYMRGEHE